MSKALARAILDAASDVGQAAADSVVTIAHRLPILAQPGAVGMAEWQDCVSEKTVAAWDGAVDVVSAWQASILNAFSWPLTPEGVARHAVALACVAARPGHVRVRANATRFGQG